jgi:nitrate/nitrite transporter NarK
MLALVSAACAALALNWFNLAPALNAIGEEYGIGVAGLSVTVSAFVLAYALFHVPGGILSARLGIRKALAIGAVVQALGAILSGLAPNLWSLCLARIVCGLGGSITIAVSVAAVSAWFYGKELSLALGMSAAGAFTVGLVLALYVWTYVQAAVGWRPSLVIAGVLQLVVAGLLWAWFRTPPGHEYLDGARVEGRGLRTALRNREVWIYSVSFMGTYAAYVIASGLVISYAVSARGMSATEAGLLGAVASAVGIPASFLGGWLNDRTRNVRLIVGVSGLLVAASMAVIPFGSIKMVWVGTIGVLFFFIVAFAAWNSVPADVARVPLKYVGAACGLMFTVAGVGGFVLPVAFGFLAESAGYVTAFVAMGAFTAVVGLLAFAGRNGGGARSAAHDTTPQGESTPDTIPVSDLVVE